MTADPPALEVVAAVIADKRGRILLNRRPAGRELAGLWEFPGGKIEPGESPEAALVRELNEELGIRAQVDDRLMTVQLRGPDKRLRLDVYRVSRWEGTPLGHEGQALMWVTPDRLPRYSMPPADRPVVAALLQPERYLVTPSPSTTDADWLAALAASIKSGIGLIHLRLPQLESARRYRLIEQALRQCRRAGVDALINADIALAAEHGAGVHLKAAQLASLKQRPLPEGQQVAASCHTAEDLAHAERLGCDFVVIGPVNDTPTHPGQASLGWAGFLALRELTALPVYAIGGLSPADIGIAREHGGQGVAAIRGLWRD